MNLSTEQKKKLLIEVGNTAHMTKALSPTLLGQQLTIWPGSLANKKQAVENLLLASQPSATPTVTVVKKSDEMKRLIQQVLNTSTASTTQITSHNSVQTSNRSTAVVGNEITATKTLMLGLKELKQILPLLGIHNGMGELQEANYKLTVLQSLGSTCLFPWSSDEESNIADRPNYHLYWIHSNEARHLLQSDMNYGGKAFAGVFPADNCERLRAVQRTMVEVALQGLETAIKVNDRDTMVNCLDILEEIKLDVKDRIGPDNVAYALNGKFYKCHCEHRNNGESQLINPDDPQFHGNFGQYGMRVSTPGIEIGIKLEAIQQVRDALKAAWKL